MALPPVALREAVAAVYDEVARQGARAPVGLGFPTGRDLALALGYGPESLAALPEPVLAAFVGAGALADRVAGAPGDVVLDLGCGAGVDGRILASRGYRVLSLDASEAMLRLGPLTEGRLALRALLPRLPFRDACARWVLLNGVANLVPDRAGLLSEVCRCLVPGGTLLVADLLQIGPIPREVRALPEAWAWCVGGAAPEEEWRCDLAGAGFSAVEVSIDDPSPPLARALLVAGKPLGATRST